MTTNLEKALGVKGSKREGEGRDFRRGGAGGHSSAVDCTMMAICRGPSTLRALAPKPEKSHIVCGVLREKLIRPLLPGHFSLLLHICSIWDCAFQEKLFFIYAYVSWIYQTTTRGPRPFLAGIFTPLHTCLSPTLASVAVSEASAQTLSPIGWKSKGTGLYWPHDFQLVTAGVTVLRMRPRIIQRCSQPGKICKQTGSKGGAGQIQSLSFWTGAERGDGQINVFVA